MKLTQEGQAMLDAGGNTDPALRLVMEVARRNIAGTDDHLEALLVELEKYFDGDLPAAIEAVSSGAIAFELAEGRWRIFNVLGESGR
jgi:hypothetical protein